MDSIINIILGILQLGFPWVFDEQLLQNTDKVSNWIVGMIFVLGDLFIVLSIKNLLEYRKDKKFKTLKMSNLVVLCTLLGLIGTFYGMATSVSNLNVSSQFGEEDFMLKAKGLLSGMGTAFQTSLVGIYTSIIISLFTFLHQLILQPKASEVKSESPIAILSNIDQNLSNLNQNQTLVLLNQRLEQIEKTMIRDDKLAAYLNMYVKIPLLDIKKELINQDQNLIKDLLNDLKTEILIPIKQEINTSNQNSKMLQAQIKSYSDHISQNIDKMIQFQQEVNKSISTNLDKIVHVQEVTSKSTQVALSQLASFESKFKDITDAITKKAIEMLDQTSNKLERQLIELIPKMLNDVNVMTQEQLTRFREEYQRNLNTFFREQNQALAQSLGKYSNELNHVVGQLHTVFDAETERRLEISKELDHHFIKMTKITEEFTRLESSLNAIMASFLPSLETASKHVGGALKESFKYTQTVQENSQKFANQIKDVMNQIQEYQGKVNQEIDQKLPIILSNLTKIVLGLEQSTKTLIEQQNRK